MENCHLILCMENFHKPFSYLLFLFIAKLFRIDKIYSAVEYTFMVQIQSMSNKLEQNRIWGDIGTGLIFDQEN